MQRKMQFGRSELECNHDSPASTPIGRATAVSTTIATKFFIASNGEIDCWFHFLQFKTVGESLVRACDQKSVFLAALPNRLPGEASFPPWTVIAKAKS
jgi:hypothetical protein